MDQNTQLPQQVCIKQKFAIGKEGEKKFLSDSRTVYQ